MPPGRRTDSRAPEDWDDDELNDLLDEQYSMQDSWAAAPAVPAVSRGTQEQLLGSARIQNSCDSPQGTQAPPQQCAAAVPASELQGSCADGAAQTPQAPPLPPGPQPVTPLESQHLPHQWQGSDPGFCTDDEEDDAQFVGPGAYTQGTQEDEVLGAGAPPSEGSLRGAACTPAAAAGQTDNYSDGLYMDVTLGSQTIRSRVRNARVHASAAPVAALPAAGSLLSTSIDRLMDQVCALPLKIAN